MMTIIIGFSGHAHLKLLGISNRLAFYTLALGHDTWHADLSFSPAITINQLECNLNQSSACYMIST